MSFLWGCDRGKKDRLFLRDIHRGTVQIIRTDAFPNLRSSETTVRVCSKVKVESLLQFASQVPVPFQGASIIKIVGSMRAVRKHGSLGTPYFATSYRKSF